MAYHVKRVGAIKWRVEVDNVFEWLTVATLICAVSIIASTAVVLLVSQAIMALA